MAFICARYYSLRKGLPRKEGAMTIRSKLALLGLLALLCAIIVPYLGASSANANPPRLQEP